MSAYKGTKYKLIYTPDKLLHTNNADLAVGLNTKKAIIFAMSPDLSFTMDYKGSYGVGPNTIYIPFNNERDGKRIEEFLKSTDYSIIALATKTTRQYIKLALIEYLKFPITKHNNNTKKNSKLRTIRKTRKT